jgi:hypothetical protein
MATYLPNITDVIPEPALFTPNFSFIDTMLRRRQGLYEQGFAQVNSAYNFVNRNVSHAYSSKVRDEFLKQANQNLKNLSSLDLSQQQNVKAAASVFEPFVKNRLVLGDMAFTAHLDQQVNIGESFRLKDGGKEFSEFNLAYINQQRQAFANDDISSVNQYYANRRSFTPYHDYYKEVQEKMKDFKPSTYKIDHIDGYYKITKDDKSWREAEVAEYLNGVLSDKSKQQMRIEAQVTFGANPENLSVAYKQVAEQQLEMNNYNANLIDKQLATTVDKNAVQLLQTKKQRLEDDNRDINTNLENIAKGDLSFVKNNSEKLSSSIYFNSKLSNFVKSFARDEVSISIDADQVGLAIMRENRADARQTRALNARKEELEGGVGNFQTGTIIGEGSDVLDSTISSLQKNVDQYQRQINDLHTNNKEHILNKVRERNPDTKLTIDQIDQAFITNWLKTGGIGGKEVSKNDLYYRNQQAAYVIASQKNADLGTISNIENAATQGMSADEKRKLIQFNREVGNIGTITLDDGSKITGKELATGIKNGTISATTFNNMGAIKINGKTHYVAAVPLVFGGASVPIIKNNQLLSAYNKIEGLQSKMGGTYEKYMSNRENYVEQNYPSLTVGKNIIILDEGSPGAKSLESSLGSYLVPGYDVKHVGIGSDQGNQGNTYYYITPKSGSDVSSDTEEIVAQLTARGARVKAITTEEGLPVFEVEGLNNNVANQYRQFSPLEVSILTQMKRNEQVKEYHSTPFNTINGDTQFTIKKYNNLYYLHVNGLRESFPDAFNSPVEALTMARLLSSTEIDPRTGKKISGYGAKMFEREVGGSPAQMFNESGVDYNYNYEY